MKKGKKEKMNLGVRAHDLCSQAEISDFVSTREKYGFSLIQLVLPKARKDFSFDKGYLESLSSALDQKGIKVARLGAYFNPVHSDKDIVRKGIRNFKKRIDIAPYFHHPLIGSETGSYSDSPWVYHPRNRTEEGYRKSKEVFLSLASYAKEKGESIAIEPAYGHVRYSVDVLKRLFDDLKRENVYATIDLYNLLDVSNFSHRNEIFHEALSAFKEKVRIIHLKDGRIKEGKRIQVPPLKGEFDYPFRRREIKKYCKDATRIFEGVKAIDILESKKGIEDLWENGGKSINLVFKN